MKNPLTLAGIEPATVRSVSQHLNHCATAVPKRNEYQEYILRVKAAGALGWQPYNFHVPIVLKDESLSLLEPSGPVQACNGIALPLRLYCYVTYIVMTVSIKDINV